MSVTTKTMLICMTCTAAFASLLVNVLGATQEEPQNARRSSKPTSKRVITQEAGEDEGESKAGSDHTRDVSSSSHLNTQDDLVRDNMETSFLHTPLLVGDLHVGAYPALCDGNPSG